MPAGTGEEGWAAGAFAIWYHIVRPIAVGGMLVGALHAVSHAQKLDPGNQARGSGSEESTGGHEAVDRTERDLSSKVVFAGLAAVFVCMIALYLFFTGSRSGQPWWQRL